MGKTEYDKLHSQELYYPSDESIMVEQLKCMAILDAFNLTSPADLAEREAYYKKMFRAVGEGVYIEPPLNANFGGKFVTLGKNVYINSNLTLVDDTYIEIGDYCMFGPNVMIATAAHPLDPDLRRRGYQYNLPVKIGANCWLGAGVMVMPGVTIGENTVIGAGSIVTKDLPANVLAMGSPCRVVREIGAYDREYYAKGKKIPENLLDEK